MYAGTETDICYANHVEAVFCISGKMILVDRDENEEHVITPGTLHILDDADNHTIKPIEDSTFLCIFTPALTGREDHDENGVYPLLTDEVVEAKEAAPRPPRIPGVPVRPLAGTRRQRPGPPWRRAAPGGAG